MGALRTFIPDIQYLDYGKNGACPDQKVQIQKRTRKEPEETPSGESVFHFDFVKPIVTYASLRMDCSCKFVTCNAVHEPGHIQKRKSKGGQLHT
jgi:hypothetical protein